MENNKSIALLTICELQHLIKVNISENMSSLKNNILEEYLKPELTIAAPIYIRKVKSEYYKNIFDIPKAQKSINFLDSLIVKI